MMDVKKPRVLQMAGQDSKQLTKYHVCTSVLFD